MTRDQSTALDQNLKFIIKALSEGWIISKLGDSRNFVLELTSENREFTIKLCLEKSKGMEIPIEVYKNEEGSRSFVKKIFLSEADFQKIV